MPTFKNHTNAALATCSLVLLGATIAGALAATTGNARADRLLDSFITGGSNSTFDLAAFIAHPCYPIVGIEAQMCKESYGLTESLKNMLESGQVAEDLRQRGINASSLPQASVEPSSSTSSSMSVFSSSSSSSPGTGRGSTEVSQQRSLSDRSRELWAICKQWFRGPALSSCFQRNARLLSRSDVDVEGNVR